jgi:hypothetical protein
MSLLGHGAKDSRRAYVFRVASDSCRKRAAPALTFSANSGKSEAVFEVSDYRSRLEPVSRHPADFDRYLIHARVKRPVAMGSCQMAYRTGFSYGKTGTALAKKREKLRKSDNQSFCHLGMSAKERPIKRRAKSEFSPSGSSISSR